MFIRHNYKIKIWNNDYQGIMKKKKYFFFNIIIIYVFYNFIGEWDYKFTNINIIL